MAVERMVVKAVLARLSIASARRSASGSCSLATPPPLPGRLGVLGFVIHLS